MIHSSNRRDLDSYKLISLMLIKNLDQIIVCEDLEKSALFIRSQLGTELNHAKPTSCFVVIILIK